MYLNQSYFTHQAEILEGLSEHITESQVRFLVRRECVLEDTPHTWPNFCVYDCSGEFFILYVHNKYVYGYCIPIA